jgi:hypothetical protein
MVQEFHLMKRFIACLVIGGFSLGMLGGCGEETKVKTKETVKTPTGSETKTTEKKVETTGDKSPPKAP